ncbi:MAG: hypothetical protein CM1200mP39_24650 [Dehalococcoidia bacterium]|nr:MAG: hypothetical protein CM1200mP39_24650 [Dehalococcoidia bacterium]
MDPIPLLVRDINEGDPIKCCGARDADVQPVKVICHVMDQFSRLSGSPKSAFSVIVRRPTESNSAANSSAS